MFRWFLPLILISHEMVVVLSISDYSESNYHSQSKSTSHSESSSHRSKKGSYSYKTTHYSPISNFGYSSDLHLPLGYGFKYASDFDVYDPDLDPDFIGIGSFYIDSDLDLDLDFTDLDLDIDLLKLKYGLYGLNHFSSREPHFNDYRFRHRLRHYRKPHYRLKHRYFPKYWKPDLDFWGLDNYSLGYEYNTYGYDIHTPTSYVHVRRY